jgi:sterol desaturase/sphingolipid hydroxylase (fatty acid hydroxylase superfamily)
METYLNQLLQFAEIAARPFLVFLESSSAVYWPYLLSAGVLAIGLPMIASRSSPQSAMATFRQQFSRKIWWAPSTKADYRYYIVNAFIYAFIFAPLLFASVDIGYWVNDRLVSWLGARQHPLLDATSLRVLYTITFFVAFDFGRFLAHWLQHEVPVLWQFHKVHHSAEALTPMTSYRVHPVDLMIMSIGGNLFGGIVIGIFFYISVGEVTIYTFLGTHLLIAIYNMIGNLRHSHVWLDYGLLGYILISPAQHQIHHSKEPRHIGKNCGFALAIWDGLFGTLYVPKSHETFEMGLGDGTDGDWHSVGRLYLWPLKMVGEVISGQRKDF